MRRLLVLTLAAAVAAVPVVSVSAGPGKKAGKYKRSMVFLGLVTAVSADEDPETMDSLTFSMIKGNKHARNYVEDNPGDVTVMIGDATRMRGLGSTDFSLSDFLVGDGVKVKARMNQEGDLMARKVRLKLHRYAGVLDSYDATLMEGAVAVSKANRVGNAYLASLGDPPLLPLVVTPETHVERDGGGDPQTGDSVHLRGRPTEDGTGVAALRLHAAPPGP